MNSNSNRMGMNPPIDPTQNSNLAAPGTAASQPPKPIPVITREILALLTPQQLQQFKSHPQFQEIMHNFMQLQQQQQLQQQHNPHQPQTTLQTPHQPSHQSSHQLPQQPPQGPQSFYQQPRQQSRLQPQHPSQLQHQAPNQRQPSTHRQAPNQPQLQPHFQQSYPPNGASSHASPTINHAPRPAPASSSSQVPMSQSPYAYDDGTGPRPEAFGHMHPASVPLNMVPPSAGPPAPGMATAHPLLATPAAALQGARARPDAMEMPGSRPEIPLTPMKDLHEWLEKFKREGKDVPLDITLYETLITRDANYEVQARIQALDNKHGLERMAKDVHAYNHIKQLRMNAINATMKNQISNSIWGEGYQGYGNGITNTATKIFLPAPDKTDRQINEPVLQRIGLEPELVPIRLEFEQERDRFKLRDTFVWDRNEQGLLLERFVRQMLNDYKFLDALYWEPVVASIKEQINDYQKKPALPAGELRVPIKIDITMNNAQLTDQFEWDILNAHDNDPEDFATVMCDEMGLPGDFCTAVAHSIREQVQAYLKALYIVGYSFDGLAIQEDEIRSRVLPLLRMATAPDAKLADDFFSILRNPSTVGDFSPVIVRLSRMEIERIDKEIERDSRRKRRHVASDHDPQASAPSRHTTSRRLAVHTGRGGPTIPELNDVPKTFRTPYCSSVLPGAIDFGVPPVHDYTEVFAQKTQVPNPNYKPPAPPRDRYRVRYQHDPTIGTFFVKIKMPRPYQ